MKKGKTAAMVPEKVGIDAITAAMAQRLGATRELARKSIDAFAATVRDLATDKSAEIAPGVIKKIPIPRFGAFILSGTKERQGKNPLTQEVITIPAGYRVGFAIAGDWKDSLRAMGSRGKKAKPRGKAKS